MNELYDLWGLFSYDVKVQKTFPYLGQYMQKIERHRVDIENSSVLMRRFMLAGLFLDYRAYNHMGYPMSTKDALNDPQQPRPFRLYLFQQYTSEEIIDTSDYLQKIGMSYGKILLLGFRLLKPNTFLYRFVTRG